MVKAITATQIKAWIKGDPKISQLSKNDTFECKTCKGKGKQTISMTTFGSSKPAKEIEIDCVSCHGKGKTDYSNMITNLIESHMWCKCDDSSGSDFFDNGKHKDCMTKHHYHCRDCGMVSQIG